ncbi:MAG: hypothetical protein HY719_10195 [Planctomycetes bacterium]|nr:hypothetical protein [Planctomycetota bacterium]
MDRSTLAEMRLRRLSPKRTFQLVDAVDLLLRQARAGEAVTDVELDAVLGFDEPMLREIRAHDFARPSGPVVMAHGFARATYTVRDLEALREVAARWTRGVTLQNACADARREIDAAAATANTASSQPATPAAVGGGSGPRPRPRVSGSDDPRPPAAETTGKAGKDA